jgi:hypothetical protein
LINIKVGTAAIWYFSDNSGMSSASNFKKKQNIYYQQNISIKYRKLKNYWIIADSFQCCKIVLIFIYFDSLLCFAKCVHLYVAMYLDCWFLGLVYGATFNNISAISWQSWAILVLLKKHKNQFLNYNWNMKKKYHSPVHIWEAISYEYVYNMNDDTDDFGWK